MLGPNSEFIPLIHKAAASPEFQELKQMKEFYLEKLRVLWNNFERDRTPSFNADQWKMVQDDFLQRKYSFSRLYELMQEIPATNYGIIYTELGKLIANFDTNAYKSREWNEYNPPRHLAFSGVLTTSWVKNLLKYKAQNNDVYSLTPTIRNAVLFIKKPADNIAVLSETHRGILSELILGERYNTGRSDNDFELKLFGFFRELGIAAVNPENNGILYSWILYKREVQDYWRSGKVAMPAEEEITEEEKEDSALEGETAQSSTQAAAAGFRYYNQPFAPSDAISPSLGVEKLAAELASLLRTMGGEKGQMVGLFGQWGRGKTYLANETVKRLREGGHFIPVNFHAWKYQDTQAVWAYLYECISAEYFRPRPGSWWLTSFFSKQRKRLRLSIQKFGWWPWIALLLSIAGATVSFFFIEKQNFISPPGGLAALFSLFAASSAYFNFVRQRTAEKASELIERYFSSKSFNDLLGVQSEIQEELKSLLCAWIKVEEGKIPGQRLLLFVDDIDRCPEDQIIRIIDALRIMLEDEELSKRILILAAIDERMLKRAINAKYHDLLSKDPELKDTNMLKLSFKNITQEYMDKLFISGIKLGVLTNDERSKLLGTIIDTEKKRAQSANTDAAETETEEEHIRQYNALNLLLREQQKEEEAEQATQKTSTTEASTESKQEENESTTGSRPVESPKVTETPPFALSSDEEKALQSSVLLMADATPRKIRILYYRYLLARNLLSAELNADNELKPEFLADYLAIYSAASHVEMIVDQKRLMALSLAKKEAHVQVPLPSGITGNVISLPPADAGKLFEVLETVIAY